MRYALTSKQNTNKQHYNIVLSEKYQYLEKLAYLKQKVKSLIWYHQSAHSIASLVEGVG